MVDSVTAATAELGRTAFGRLQGHGRMDWPALAELVGDAPCAWADYHGFHIGAFPAAPPPYTHLWSWSARLLMRTRIDGDRAVVGLLAIGDEPPPGPARTTEKVTYRVYPGRTWGTGEKRVGPVPASVAGRAVDLYQLAGAHPVTFIRLTGQPA